MNRKEYLQERSTLINLEAEAYKSFEKTIITIASGAIAVSLTFFDKTNNGNYESLLLISWILWLSTIIAQLISSYITAKAMREEQLILNDLYMNFPGRKNIYAGKPTKYNKISLITFGLGTALFIFFIIINFNMLKVNDTQQDSEKKGGEPPMRAVPQPNQPTQPSQEESK